MCIVIILRCCCNTYQLKADGHVTGAFLDRINALHLLATAFNAHGDTTAYCDALTHCVRERGASLCHQNPRGQTMFHVLAERHNLRRLLKQAELLNVKRLRDDAGLSALEMSRNRNASLPQALMTTLLSFVDAEQCKKNRVSVCGVRHYVKHALVYIFVCVVVLLFFFYIEFKVACLL